MRSSRKASVRPSMAGGNVERFRTRAQRTIRIMTDDAYNVSGAILFAAALGSSTWRTSQARSSREIVSRITDDRVGKNRRE